MRVSIRLVAALSVALLVCVAAAAARKVAHLPASGPDPAVRSWAQWPHDVSCEDGLPFDPVAAFSGPTGAERGGLSSERGLRRILGSGELPKVRRHGWRRLAETENVADFAAGRLFTRPGRTGTSELEFIELERVGGHWRLGSFRASCMPRSIRDGVRATPWVLADEQDLHANTRRVRVDLEPQVCNRVRRFPLQKPELREQNGHLLMTLWRRPGHRPPSTASRLTCPPQSKRFTIELPGKLGHRQLYDGGTYPPLPVAIVIARR
jgi:hypothetical protein